MVKDSKAAKGSVVGLDLGDQQSWFCWCDASGEVVREGRVATTTTGLSKLLAGKAAVRVALEAGTHSPWVSRLIAEWGHEVIVANPRKVRLIGNTRHKNDRLDARSLADLAAVRPRLLSPIEHVSAEQQADRAMVRSRAALVRARSGLISHVRGLVKALGGRLPQCSAEAFAAKASAQVPEPLRPAVEAVLEMIAALSAQIQLYERELSRCLEAKYPQAAAMLQVAGVGELTALTIVCTLGEPARFAKSRATGAFVGLAPGQRQSGARDPQLHISKEGDPYLRQLLVQCAHYILGRYGPDCDLRRFGLKLAQRGGKAAKKKAAVAVARKLIVLLHHLWKTGETYEPLRLANRQAAQAAQAA